MSFHVGLKIVIVAEEEWDSKTKVEIFNIGFFSLKKVIHSIIKTNKKPTAQKHLLCLYCVI